jgi:hypothetical protein
VWAFTTVSNTTSNTLIHGLYLEKVGRFKTHVFCEVPSMLRPLYLKWEIPTFFSYGDEEVI